MLDNKWVRWILRVAICAALAGWMFGAQLGVLAAIVIGIGTLPFWAAGGPFDLGAKREDGFLK